MIPFGTRALTLYRRLEHVDNGRRKITWEPCALQGCSVRIVRGRALDGAISRDTFSTLIRVPVENAAPPAVGDLIVLGVVGDALTSTAELPESFLRLGYITIMAVSDNTVGAMPHYKAEGV